MNFFDSQETARRNTRRLLALFLLAVLSLILMTNVLLILTLGLAGSGLPYETVWQSMDWRLFAAVSAGVLLVIATGSLYRIASLSSGGASVAEMMQARLIPTDSNDPDHRKILNVVEEMAIASGTPVPPVYLMEEAGINAFAAGLSTGDAVIGITRGAIENLSRDELQGVVAHEFSHILHGDMRLNIRLVGLLHGILVIGLLGYTLLRSAPRTRRSKNSGGVVFLGLGLMIIGYSGTFFGNLIKAAVSRQREFLADASAVQYTRNPDGIAGALRKIGSHSGGALLQNPAGAEISHALFGEGYHHAFATLFATHPPLEERIRRIQPAGAADRPERAAANAPEGVMEGVMAQAGQPGPGQLQQARLMLAALPAVLLQSAHEPFSARALMYLLLLDGQESPDGADAVGQIRQKQLERLRQKADPAVYRALQDMLAKGLRATPEQRLPLINMALPALRQLSRPQYLGFRENLLWMIAADGRMKISEWLLQTLLIRQLDHVFRIEGKQPVRGHLELKHLQQESALILGFLAWAGSSETGGAEAAFGAAASSLAAAIPGMPVSPMPGREAIDLQRVDGALARLARLKPLQKPAFLKACAAAIQSDARITSTEVEIFRALAQTLDCPLPPLTLEKQEAVGKNNQAG